MNRSGSLLDQLAEQLDDHWPAIQKARITSEVERQKLEADLKDLSSPDTTVVVFGSVARGECTAGSDRDWILLIDGQADHEHKTQERLIADALRDKEPGASGLFGTMVSGHDLVHYIGGEDDKNSNNDSPCIDVDRIFAGG
ncbi:MAG: nucleotidyltransferase domain-containing protein [Bryobacterales bacterium]|nr:nucleotidyltransferase domain-containing protein [Bryobacterales bacterium]